MFHVQGQHLQGPEIKESQTHEELKNSFRKANVSEDSVPMFHKKVLQSRKEKTKEINDVLHWLEIENNKNFDNGAFRNSNTDIFDESYTFYTVNMQDAEMVFLKEYNISVAPGLKTITIR